MGVKLKEFLKSIDRYVTINKKPFIIGVAGGSESGKGFISKKILDSLGGGLFCRWMIIF